MAILWRTSREKSGFSDEYENIDFTHCVSKKTLKTLSLEDTDCQSFEKEIAKHISLFLVLVTGHLT